jgi:hypothetical protein
MAKLSLSFGIAINGNVETYYSCCICFDHTYDSRKLGWIDGKPCEDALKIVKTKISANGEET